jgi:hypothetical protein
VVVMSIAGSVRDLLVVRSVGLIVVVLTLRVVRVDCLYFC